MAISRVIEVSFGRSSMALVRVNTAYFYNSGIIFKPTDLDLPASYQVHWADSPNKETSLETIGTAEGAPIPDGLWNRSRVIYGWIYLHPTEDSGITAYEVRIYKNVRAGLPDGTEPTPTEQSTIDQLISALNSAVEQTGEDVESASQSAQSAENAKTAAESARDTAGEYANDAESSAASASTSASQASQSATASAQSASASAQIKADVEDLADDAQSYAESALIASQASVTARDTAQGYAQSASASAQSASTSASNASTSAQTASTKASEANTSAQTASQKATEASQSASQALSYKTDAESAKTASQTAQGLAESARDSAITAKNDAESARDDAVQAKEDAESAVASIADALDDKAPVITDTASGAIASFSDGANDLPLKSLVIDINPVQDLHGQTNPYPAGGGVNKFKYNASVGTQIINGVTWTLYEDGSIQVSGTASGASTFRYVIAERVEDDDFYFSGNYKFYAFPANISTANFQGGVRIGSKWYSVYADGYSRALNDADGKIVEAWFQVRVDKTVNATIRPMIYPESESTPTAWSPYENICPISGWTEVDVGQSGVNVFDQSSFEWGDSSLIQYVTMPIPNGTYTFSTNIPDRDGSTRDVFVFAGQVESGASSANNGVSITSPRTITVTDGYYTIANRNGVTVGDYNWQLELGSTATPYEPYTGRSITIDLGQTVYGGYLDVLSGELTVDMAIVDLGTLEWKRMTDRTYAVFRPTSVITNMKHYPSGTGNPNMICSRYPCIITTFYNDFGDANNDNKLTYIRSGGQSNKIAVQDSAYTDEASFTAAMSGVQLCYELAEPIEIQLTPNQVNSLLGVNNIWADSGDCTAEYRADTKLYIAKKIAEAISALT